MYYYYENKNKINNKYPLKQEGEKIKFTYLKTSNPLHENCVSFFSTMPPEMNRDKYVDFQLQFEKSILEPLKNVLNCVGWTHEKQVTLGRFFE